MIFLASSSTSRANLLKSADISFKQILVNYDESKVLAPVNLYTTAVVSEKYSQFIKLYDINEFLKCGAVLFADSSVICNNQILGKAKNKNEALKMLKLQSANKACVFTAMKIISSKFNLDSLSLACYEFYKFDENELKSYLKSGLWQGKAGAMMIEGFNGKYIKTKKGSKSVAMGLDIKLIKAFFSKF